jgi:ribonuclease T2
MRALWTTALLLVTALTAQAEVPLDGSFLAQRACPALQSISRQTNPGDVSITPGATYHAIAANKAEATHYWIVVPGAQPDRRWVAVECGSLDGETANTPAPQRQPQASGPKPHYTLAISWQPAFCELHTRPPECRNQTSGRFDASHFSLHGLWPEPIGNAFCDVPAQQRRDSDDGHWEDLPPVVLSGRLQSALDQVMPGTRSQLERHEWTKHGTCYGGTQEQYFADAVALINELNGSSVAELFAANLGRQLSQRQVRNAFDAAFGAGAGQRVSMDCERDGDRFLITELTIDLTGPITAETGLASLMAASRPTDGGCNIGSVDRAGLQ